MQKGTKAAAAIKVSICVFCFLSNAKRCLFAFYQALLPEEINTFCGGIINQNGDPVHPLTVFKQPVPVNGSLQTQHFFATPFSGELTQSEAIDTRKQKIDLTERQCVHADNKPNE